MLEKINMIFYQKHAKIVYTIFPFFFILFPLFPKLFSGYIGFQIIFIMELIFVCICGMFRVYKFSFTIKSFAIFLLFISNIVISILCDLFNDYLIISDLYEIIRPFAFLLFYTFYRKSNYEVKKLEITMVNSIILVFLLLSIYSVFEFLFPSVVRPISLILYKRDYKSINGIVGSFGVTYHFGYILLLPLIYSLISLLKHISFKNIFLFIIFFFTLLVIQSRSVYITCAAAFIVTFFLPYLHYNSKSSFRIIMILIILIYAIVHIYITYQEQLRTMLHYAIVGLEAMSRGNNNSVNTRELQVYWAIENNKLIFLGSGISKNIMMLESFYAQYYYRYGLISIITYTIMLIVTASASYKIAKYENVNKKISIFYYSLFVFFIISPIGLLSSCHQDSPKISFLFYGLIGLVFNKYHYLKTKDVF
jgi:hypothetical protein